MVCLLLSILCALFIAACEDSSLDLCPATSLPLFGDTSRVYPLIWRFLPAIDPQVDLFFSRDLDSRISARFLATNKGILFPTPRCSREAAAVADFLNSDAEVNKLSAES